MHHPANSVAVLVDGSFFLKRYYAIINPTRDHTPTEVAKRLYTFVPASKLARREGIDFVLDPMWNNIDDSLIEHIDGLRSTCPKPRNYGHNRSIQGK